MTWMYEIITPGWCHPYGVGTNRALVQNSQNLDIQGLGTNRALSAKFTKYGDTGARYK